MVPAQKSQLSVTGNFEQTTEQRQTTPSRSSAILTITLLRASYNLFTLIKARNDWHGSLLNALATARTTTTTTSPPTTTTI